jgi:hypothetical protein
MDTTQLDMELNRPLMVTPRLDVYQLRIQPTGTGRERNLYVSFLRNDEWNCVPVTATSVADEFEGGRERFEMVETHEFMRCRHLPTELLTEVGRIRGLTPIGAPNAHAGQRLFAAVEAYGLHGWWIPEGYRPRVGPGAVTAVGEREVEPLELERQRPRDSAV